MNRTKSILYVLGIALIIAGFSMTVYGQIRLNTPYFCPLNGCKFPPELEFQNITLPTIFVYLGLGLIVAGSICIVIGKKIRG